MQSTFAKKLTSDHDDAPGRKLVEDTLVWQMIWKMDQSNDGCPWGLYVKVEKEKEWIYKWCIRKRDAIEWWVLCTENAKKWLITKPFRGESYYVITRVMKKNVIWFVWEVEKKYFITNRILMHNNRNILRMSGLVDELLCFY